MKLSLVFLVLWLPLFASTEKKIIVASFPTQHLADNALAVFESKLGKKLLKKQQHSYFNIIARASGTSYIIAIEPLKNYQEALQVKALLPREYADAFINSYTPPKTLVVETKNVENILTQITSDTQPPATLSKQQLTEETTHYPDTAEQKVPESITHSTSDTTPTDLHHTPPVSSPHAASTPSPGTLFSSLSLPLEYLLIGMGIVLLTLLLGFVRYYRKYHALKKELLCNNAPDNDNAATTSKSSDIFFVRQH